MLPIQPPIVANFAIRVPRGGRHFLSGCVKFVDYFNSRPRVGATCSLVLCAVSTLFQFTPPRGGRRIAHGDYIVIGGISIHAPAWGATDGAYPVFVLRKNFNSRPRVGGDRKREAAERLRDISIHAPAWGATIPCPGVVPPSCNFNSRPRVGGDLRPVQRFSHLLISIHAPAWGATSSTRRKCTFFSTFQFTPPRGGRLLPVPSPFKPIEISIHAPAWGATAKLTDT